MNNGSGKGIQPFISWREDYDSHVKIVDRQHQGILGFINNWYGDLKGKLVRPENVVAYMGEKYSYLEFYSKAHLAFEEKMLDILVAKHGFPAEEQAKHLKIHQTFIRGFMQGGSEQMGLLMRDQSASVLNGIAEDTLKDVARWWFGHIRTPGEMQPAGPDYQYRMFLQKLSAEAKVDLLNDLVLYFEESTVSTNSPA
jgi:hemerythrin